MMKTLKVAQQGLSNDCLWAARADDPIVRVPMVLSPADIDFFPCNPRRTGNPAFSAIQASILANGDLEQPIPVSRDPETGRFVAYRGGNTRLAIVKAAWEAGDTRFRQVWCEWHPWEGVLVGMVAHVVENELRGELRLIDKALAVQQIRDRLEAEDGESLSQRAFLDELKHWGWVLSLRSLQMYLQAARFHGFCPLALESGGGRSFIAGLGRIETAVQALSTFDDPVVKSENLSERFHNLLKSMDRAGLSCLDVEVRLTAELATVFGWDAARFQPLWTAAKCGEDLIPAAGDRLFAVEPKPAPPWEQAKQRLFRIGHGRPASRVAELPAIFEALDTVDELQAVKAALEVRMTALGGAA